LPLVAIVQLNWLSAEGLQRSALSHQPRAAREHIRKTLIRRADTPQLHMGGRTVIALFTSRELI